jgi:hypothetical protein
MPNTPWPDYAEHGPRLSLPGWPDYAENELA